MGDLSKNISRREIACHCGCGTANFSPAAVAAFQQFREICGRPMIFISGCRCPAHNSLVGGEPNSFHLAQALMDGRAGDVRVPGLTLREMYQNALLVPAFKNGGIGVYPDGNNRFLHLDVRGVKARWGRIRGKYVSIEEALEHV